MYMTTKTITCPHKRVVMAGTAVETEVCTAVPPPKGCKFSISGPTYLMGWQTCSEIKTQGRCEMSEAGNDITKEDAVRNGETQCPFEQTTGG